ncbi:hypothetical protein CYMTET_9302 [Cymbomonas tetramitiformis]|uniref:Uncharacterized protein n=1 Tax=Cymbomonas tetramitiformis TaxID=36881 RepID=A0AAE0GRH8_9CHLO|nr:hypothetical protein CYMTET_9302 [Cymbomonas tetramitiformis]
MEKSKLCELEQSLKKEKFNNSKLKRQLQTVEEVNRQHNKYIEDMNKSFWEQARTQREERLKIETELFMLKKECDKRQSVIKKAGHEKQELQDQIDKYKEVCLRMQIDMTNLKKVCETQEEEQSMIQRFCIENTFLAEQKPSLTNEQYRSRNEATRPQKLGKREHHTKV